MALTPILYLPPPVSDGLLAHAEALLTAPEREALAELRFPKRRRDWLLGRLAAKEALSRATGGVWRPEAVTITRAESGCPAFSGPDARLSGWSVSISHGHGRAAAIATPGPGGVDLELVRAVEPGGWRFFLTPEERDWLGAEPLGPRGEIVCWALKEAAYKAIAGRVPSVLSLPVSWAREGRAGLASPEGAIAGRYVRAGEFVLAVAAPGAPEWLEALPLSLTQP